MTSLSSACSYHKYLKECIPRRTAIPEMMAFLDLWDRDSLHKDNINAKNLPETKLSYTQHEFEKAHKSFSDKSKVKITREGHNFVVQTKEMITDKETGVEREATVEHVLQKNSRTEACVGQALCKVSVL